MGGVLLTLFLFSWLMVSCEQIVMPSSRPPIVAIDDYMVKLENRNGAGQQMALMPNVAGAPEAVSGDLLITLNVTDEGKKTKSVYNLIDGRKLAEVPEEHEVGFISTMLDNPEKAEGIFYILDNDVAHLYNSDGSEAISAFYETEEPYLVTETLNGFSFNGAEYYVRDGSVLFEGYDPLDSEYFNASVKYNDRYYYLSEELVFVFDERGRLLYEYILPSYAENGHIFVLSNGNIFIQYTYTVIEGEEYDFVSNGEKHRIVSLHSNLAKNTETAQTLSFLVESMENPFTDPDFHKQYTERVVNLAKVVDVSNRRIDVSQPARYVVLSDSLIEIFSLFDIVNGATDIYRASYDRNLVVTAAGNHLVDGNGVIIGQLNNYRCITEKYIVTSGAIYDHDLRVVLDLTKEGYTFFAVVGDNLLLSKVMENAAGLYLFRGGDPFYISDVSHYVPAFAGYAIKEEDGRCRYYDENGALLVDAVGEIEWFHSSTEDDVTAAIGYAADDTGHLTYYRLTYNEFPYIT